MFIKKVYIKFKIWYICIYGRLVGDSQIKQAINFRLSQQSLLTLNMLAKTFQLSKTQIIEKAIMNFYEQDQKQPVSPLLSLAGSLDNDEAQIMLQCVSKDRKNKNVRTKL